MNSYMKEIERIKKQQLADSSQFVTQDSHYWCEEVVGKKMLCEGVSISKGADLLRKKTLFKKNPLNIMSKKI